MDLRLGIDVACRESHRAALADATGKMLWSNRRFTTTSAELEEVWDAVRRTAGDAEGVDVTVVMEPTRNAWVSLAAWLRARGATVRMVPPEQSADLRKYYNKHTKTDRLDCELLARLPLPHPDGLLVTPGLGPAEVLRRAVGHRSSLVARRTAGLQRLDALLELLGPAWTAARETLRLWTAPDVSTAIDFAELAEDIAVEARLIIGLNEEIAQLEDRTQVHYEAADPQRIVASAPGVGDTLAAAILGRLGDARRFRNLAAVRNYTGLVPKVSQSGTTDVHNGPTKSGDHVLRQALSIAADHARRVDPTLPERSAKKGVASAPPAGPSTNDATQPKAA